MLEATIGHFSQVDKSKDLATVLGFDYGARRIGVAVGNRLSGARALEVVATARKDRISPASMHCCANGGHRRCWSGCR